MLQKAVNGFDDGAFDIRHERVKLDVEVGFVGDRLFIVRGMYGIAFHLAAVQTNFSSRLRCNPRDRLKFII